jgi:aspartyl-tRNA(Asn)/glutamyl-tRNA(Gln) amidotransferase subunit C
MKINIKHIAKLANLSLSSDEEQKFTSQLEETLEYVEELNEVDTQNVKPTNQVTGLENVTRKDETEPSLSQEEALANTNSKHNGFFKVNAIFDNES